MLVNYLHSCRDKYTAYKLASNGFNNLIVTVYPSIWDIENHFCEMVPKEKEEIALVCFTDYNQDLIRDKLIASAVNKCYEDVYCWIQSPLDYDYIKIVLPNAQIVPPNIGALEQFLHRNEGIDYIWTRPHAGIKCLHNRRRSIIIVIDNRAVEMKNDFGFPVLLER